MSDNKTRDWPLISRRIGYAASFVMVAGVAATVSYTHIRDVARYGHQSGVVAHLLPLAVDGMMLVATLAMAEDKAADRLPRGWARFGFWFGAVISTVANIAATVVEWGWDALSIGVAALAPVLLLLAIEIVARPGKLRLPAILKGIATPATAVETPAIEVPETAAAIVEDTLPEAPVSGGAAGTRKPYGPRKGDAYSERQDRRIRTGK